MDRRFEMQRTQIPDTRPNLHLTIREEMQGLIYKTLNEELRQHEERVRASQIQYGLEIREAYREYFLSVGHQLPARLSDMHPSFDLDVDTGLFMKIGGAMNQ